MVTSTMKLSIVVPVYNEKNYVEEMLNRVQRLEFPPEWNLEREVVVIDDFSTDGSRDILKKINDSRFKIQDSGFKVIFHDKNMGKGAALRTGFRHLTGDIVAIQDADLEYDPLDLIPMVKLILEDKADIVFGSRFYGNPHRVMYYHHYIGNRIISTLINILCDTMLTDVETCYKVFRRKVLDGIRLTCDDFGFEVEFTVKTAKTRLWRIYETGISYYGRTYNEGKKIGWKDGIKALWYIMKFRL